MHPHHTPIHVPLLTRDGSLRGYTLVDADDSAWVNQYAWRLRPNGYACRRHQQNGRNQSIWLHREILGLPQTYNGLEADHINRDRLDNRRVNLRIVTHAQNLQNLSVKTDRTSKHRGVYWHKTQRRWLARVKINGHTIYLGRFTDEAEAAQVAAEARARLMPFATS